MDREDLKIVQQSQLVLLMTARTKIHRRKEGQINQGIRRLMYV
jgi:hypothetical protein